jgi:hypothetical protein
VRGGRGHRRRGLAGGNDTNVVRAGRDRRVDQRAGRGRSDACPDNGQEVVSEIRE